jgi:hypothetical protein
LKRGEAKISEKIGSYLSLSMQKLSETDPFSLRPKQKKAIFTEFFVHFHQCGSPRTPESNSNAPRDVGNESHLAYLVHASSSVLIVSATTKGSFAPPLPDVTMALLLFLPRWIELILYELLLFLMRNKGEMLWLLKLLLSC